MKQGKLRIGDIFIDKTMKPSSIYRVGVVMDIISTDGGNTCKVQVAPQRCMWITSEGLRKNELYEYVGHVDLNKVFDGILGPYREKERQKDGNDNGHQD